MGSPGLENPFAFAAAFGFLCFALGLVVGGGLMWVLI